MNKDLKPLILTEHQEKPTKTGKRGTNILTAKE